MAEKKKNGKQPSSQPAENRDWLHKEWKLRGPGYQGLILHGHGTTLHHCYFEEGKEPKEDNLVLKIPDHLEEEDESTHRIYTYPILTVGHYTNEQKERDDGINRDFGRDLYGGKTPTHRDGNYSLLTGMPRGFRTIVLPEGLVTIAQNTFAQQDYVKTVNIPSTVTHIKQFAFEGCTGLEKAPLPDHLKEIGARAFKDCRNLDLTLPASLRADAIGLSALDSTGITTLVWPSKPAHNTVTDYVCYNCQNLTKVALNENVWTLGKACFRLCSALKQIALPDSLHQIEKWAFRSSGLETITIPETVQEISFGAFQECACLREIKLPSKLKTIEENAFRGCTALRTIPLPDSVTWIGPSAFQDCTALETVHLPGKLKFLQKKAFRNCRNLKEVTLPPSVKKIGSEAFSQCSSLQKIMLPPSLEQIESDTFSHCSALQEMTLPPSVQQIGSKAFFQCSALQVVHLSRQTKLARDAIPTKVTLEYYD